MSGCSTTTGSVEKQTAPRLPATTLGVRIAADGSAVAEMDMARSSAFDASESHLRKALKVTFVNHTLGELEAEDQDLLFQVKITSLTTGKTGLAVKATHHARGTLDFYAARDLADELVAAIKSPAKKGVRLRSGKPDPRAGE